MNRKKLFLTTGLHRQADKHRWNRIRTMVGFCILLFSFSTCESGDKQEKPKDTPPVKAVSQDLELIMSFVSGDVSSGKKLSSGDTLSKGSTLITGDKSLADVQPIFPGLIGTLRLEQKSELAFSDRNWDGKKEVLLFLKKGDATINTKETGSARYILITPTLVLTLNNTSKFGVKVASTGSTYVEVYEGEILVRFALPEEVAGFPYDLEKNESTAKFISENLSNAGSKLDMGGKMTISPKQRDDFVKKRKR
jgi:hypothetical protein